MSASIRFGKDKYHLHVNMEEWCAVHLGAGGWAYTLLDNDVWCIQSMFGNTTFTFRNDADATMFRLVWGSGIEEGEYG